MKEIKFRPLRRIKKTGKITIASYMQWRKVKTADYNKFILIVDSEYKRFPRDEYVYDHNGEVLYWRDFNVEDIPVMPPIHDEEFVYPPSGWRADLGGNGYYWGVRGLDCDGVPTFSHHTADEVVTHHYKDVSEFQILTVGIVAKWFGWFLYQLNNSCLK